MYAIVSNRLPGGSRRRLLRGGPACLTPPVRRAPRRQPAPPSRVARELDERGAQPARATSTIRPAQCHCTSATAPATAPAGFAALTRSSRAAARRPLRLASGTSSQTAPRHGRAVTSAHLGLADSAPVQASASMGNARGQGGPECARILRAACARAAPRRACAACAGLDLLASSAARGRRPAPLLSAAPCGALALRQAGRHVSRLRCAAGA